MTEGSGALQTTEECTDAVLRCVAELQGTSASAGEVASTWSSRTLAAQARLEALCVEEADGGSTAAGAPGEEAGVEGEVTGPAIGFYRDRKVHPMRRKLIEVAMYPLRVSKQLEDWPEKDERQRHWATLEEARKLLTTPGLFELVERAEEHILAEQETSGAGHQA